MFNRLFRPARLAPPAAAPAPPGLRVGLIARGNAGKSVLLQLLLRRLLQLPLPGGLHFGVADPRTAADLVRRHRDVEGGLRGRGVLAGLRNRALTDLDDHHVPDLTRACALLEDALQVAPGWHSPSLFLKGTG